MQHDKLHSSSSLDGLGGFLHWVYFIRPDDETVAANSSQLGSRELVGFAIQQGLSEEGYHINKNVVVDWRQVLQEFTRNGLDVLRVNLKGGEERPWNDRRRQVGQE